MTLGIAEAQPSLLDEVDRFCDEHLDEQSVFGLLHRERDRLFPDAMFEDLYDTVGRRSVPPSILATLTVLQRLCGLSDRDTVERFTFDARFRYACGVGGWDDARVDMDHTVLVRFRMRLRDSQDPKRIFRATTEVAAEAGLLGVSRVLDSAPLHDAVATMDTVTLVRAGIRRVLATADGELQEQLRSVLVRDDDYAQPGKPACDWEDPDAREALVDALACDGVAVLEACEHRPLSEEVAEAVALLAAVIGQDIEQDDEGTYRIVWGTAKGRIISLVDPDATHGRKSSSGRFDGFKGHVAIDPDSEIITATAVGPANGADAAMVDELTADLDHDDASAEADGGSDDSDGGASAVTDGGSDGGDGGGASTVQVDDCDDERTKVYGDAAYGSGDTLAVLHDRQIDPVVKTQPPSNATGGYAKDAFDIDIDAHTVTCPAGHTVDYRPGDDGSGTARFGSLCEACPLRGGCTDATAGRTVTIGPHERLLADQRARQDDPDFAADYRATRPKVERKLAHLLRPGRRARRRGIVNIDLDWSLRAAGVNLVRFAKRGLRSLTDASWRATPAATAA